MASRSFASLAGGARSTLDVPVAALAGLAVAVVAFAAPADLLGNLVTATGLPSVVAAAEPPLGFKARIGLGAVGATAVFAFTFLLLRWLERNGARRASQFEEEDTLELEVEAPRLRRRDIHPDAPARAPLLAAHELGEPDFEGEESFDARAAWPSPEPAPAPEPAWEETADPVQRAETFAYPSAVDADPVASDSDQASAYALSQPRWPDPVEPEPAPIEAPAWSPSEPEPASAEIAPAPHESPLPPVHEPEQAAAAPNPWSPEPQAPPAANEDSLAPPAPGSIAELMERLERGLARRRIAPEPAAEADVEIDAPATAEPADDRLQNAINSLQRFASRQD